MFCLTGTAVFSISCLTFRGPLMFSSWTSAVDRSGLKVTWWRGRQQGGESVMRINKQFPRDLTGPHQSSTSEAAFTTKAELYTSWLQWWTLSCNTWQWDMLVTGYTLIELSCEHMCRYLIPWHVHGIAKWVSTSWQPQRISWCQLLWISAVCLGGTSIWPSPLCASAASPEWATLDLNLITL